MRKSGFLCYQYAWSVGAFHVPTHLAKRECGRKITDKQNRVVAAGGNGGESSLWVSGMDAFQFYPQTGETPTLQYLPVFYGACNLYQAYPVMWPLSVTSYMDQPVAPQALPATRAVTKGGREALAAAQDKQGKRMEETESCAVLVVSDLPAWHDFIKNGLARGGRPHDQVRFAASGDEGLAAAEQDPPDLIVYFLWTLDMNGYEFCQQIKTIAAIQNAPVLLVGATSPHLAYPEAQRVGAAGYLRHPDREQDLVAARDALLRGETFYPAVSPPPHPSHQEQKATIKKGCKVLLIDDEPELLELIQFILRHRRDDSVRYVNSGQRGLMVAEQDPPDLVILDIMMPDIDGYEVCRRIKGMPALWNVPVLFQTARAPADVIPEAKRLGAAGCITEPYGPQELLAARDAVLRGETYYPPFEIGKFPQ